MGIFYLAGTWRNVALYVNLASIPIVLIYAVIIEETPHFLLSKGRLNEAHKALVKILIGWNKRTDGLHESSRDYCNI